MADGNISERQEMLEKYPDIMNIGELCTALGIGKNTAYQLVREKRIKSIRIGKTYKIPKIYLIEFLRHPPN